MKRKWLSFLLTWCFFFCVFFQHNEINRGCSRVEKKIVDIYPQIFIFCLNIFCNLFLWIYNFFAVSSVQSISSELKSTTEGNSHGQQLNCNWAEFFDSFAFSCFAVFYFICCSFFITTATAATTTTTHWLTHSPLSRSNFNVVSLVPSFSFIVYSFRCNHLLRWYSSGVEGGAVTAYLYANKRTS